MGNLSEIRNQITQRSVADEVRHSYLKKLKDSCDCKDRDTIIYASDFLGQKAGVPSSLTSINLNDIQSLMPVLHGLKGRKLDLILHSPGGSIEAADQIVQYLRRKYEHIRVIVPQNAMSAATMIACAADEIILGKHSALGPTDPWLKGLSAHSILSEFETAKKEMANDRSCIPLWVSRIARWPAGLLAACENALELSEERVAEWLEDYMFSGKADKGSLSKEIAKWLADAKIHKTHGRPLGIDVLQDKGLKVSPLEADQTFQENILSLFHATIVTFETTNCVKLLENHEGKGVYTTFQPSPSA